MTKPIPERIGRYRIVSELGRGAMGVVYRGEDEGLGRSVAVKTILASMDVKEQEGYLARFRQEAKALGTLNHPGIITVHEFGDEAGMAFLAMEFLEGKELRDIISSERLPLTTVVDLAAQIAEGLAFAHARGIVHRDVKPGNVMVVEGNRAKLMDFGIARVRVSDVKTATGQLLGSPKYMSPEQVLGNAVDHRTDIFALGVVLHEMLTGFPPFTGENVMALMYEVCNAKPAPPSVLNPAVTRTLDLIVARALEKDPEARYQDAGALATDLRACGAELEAGGASAAASPPTSASVTYIGTRNSAMGTATIMSAPIAGLHVAGRFDSEAALARLQEPRGADRRAMAPATERPSFLQRFLGDGGLMTALALVASAAVAAWYVAT